MWRAYFIFLKKCLLTLAILFCPYFVLAFDNKNTHPGLTVAAIELFNQQTPNAYFPEEQSEWIKIGSILEDTLPRYRNHFYDPRTGKGLNAMGVIPGVGMESYLEGEPSTVWAYAQNSASGDYSIPQILANYYGGNKKRAYQGVGHILHLVQDLAVPAHTRNDPHGEGEPFEAFVKNSIIYYPQSTPIVQVREIRDLMEDSATRTNGNFFSRDTIDAVGFGLDKIKIPVQDNSEVVWAVSRGDYRLVKIYQKVNSRRYELDDEIFSDYWRKLSPRAVEYSMEALNFFQREFTRIDEELAQMTLKERITNKVLFEIGNIQKSGEYAYGDAAGRTEYWVGDTVVAVIGKIIKTARAATSDWSGGMAYLADLATGHESFYSLVETVAIVVDDWQSSEGVLMVQNDGNNSKMIKSEGNGTFQNIVLDSNTNNGVVLGIKEGTISDGLLIDSQPLVKVVKSVQIVNIRVTENEDERILENDASSNDATEANTDKEADDTVSVDGNQVKSSPFLNLPNTELSMPNEIPDIVSIFSDEAKQSGNFGSGFVIILPDGTPPETSIIMSPPIISSSSLAEFVFVANESASFEYNFQTSGWMSLDGNTLNIIAVEDGEYNLQVRAVDTAGNRESTAVEFAWMVDTTAPSILFLTAPDAFRNSSSAEFALWSDEESDYFCSVDDGEQTVCESEFLLSDLSEGAHNLAVLALDNAGNASTSSLEWVVDLLAPDLSALSISPYYPQNYFSFSLSATDELSGVADFDVDYRADGAEEWVSFASATITEEIVFDDNLALGISIELRARARDWAQNTSDWQSASTTLGTNHLVISEIQVSGATANDEFVEIYNPTDEVVSLSNYKLKRKTSGGAEYNLVANFGEASIASRGYFLVVHPSGYTGNMPADFVYGSESYAITSDNTVLLYNGDEVVDKIGFGAASDFEGAPFAQNPDDSASLERKALALSTAESLADGEQYQGNGYDFDDNSSDFVLLLTSDPQNNNAPSEPNNNDIILPSAVDDLAVMETGTDTVSLAWTAPENGNISDEAHYDLRYVTADECTLNINWQSAQIYSGENLPFPLASGGDTQSAQITGLSPLTTYCISMRVFNGEYYSVLSNQVLFTTADTPPEYTIGPSQIGFNYNYKWGYNNNCSGMKIFQTFQAESENVQGLRVKMVRRWDEDPETLIIKIAEHDGNFNDDTYLARAEYAISNLPQVASPQSIDDYAEVVVYFDTPASTTIGQLYYFSLYTGKYNHGEWAYIAYNENGEYANGQAYRYGRNGTAYNTYNISLGALPNQCIVDLQNQPTGGDFWFEIIR